MAEIRRIVRKLPPWAQFTNNSFEDSTLTGWAAGGTVSSPTFSNVAYTSPNFEGSRAAQIYGTATANQILYPDLTTRIPVTPGKKYAADAHGKVYAAAPAGSTAYVALAWYNGSTYLSTTDGVAVAADAANTLVNLSVSGVAPATATGVSIRPHHKAGGSGTLNMIWDNIQFREVVIDFNDEVNYYAVKDTFQVQQGGRGQSYGLSGTRYGGAQIASEASENDKVVWQALVTGATTDEVLYSCESIAAATESGFGDTQIEWRAASATLSTYYPVRGPAEFDLTHSAIRLESGRAEYVDLTFQVAPLAYGDTYSIIASGLSLPAVISPTLPIGGSAPAEVDVSLRFNGNNYPVASCLIGWTKRPSTPLSGSVAPFGIIEAESYSDVTTWAAIGTDTDYRGSNGIRATTSGAGTASAKWAIDPSTMEPDDFTRGTIDIEVWARVELSYAVKSPKLTLSLEPFAGTNFGAVRYTPEYGSAGKYLLNSPTASNVLFRPVRLGTLTMPVDTYQPLKWKIKVAAEWYAASSGVFGLDYLVLVPARRRASSRTGVVGDGNYPKFVQAAVDTTRIIRSDLSGLTGSSTNALGPDTGLGGAQIEFTPGLTDIVIWPNMVVPDDPTPNATENFDDSVGVNAKFYVTPRHYLVR